MYTDINLNDRSHYGDDIRLLLEYDEANQPEDGAYLLWLAGKISGMDPMLYEHYNNAREAFKRALARHIEKSAKPCPDAEPHACAEYETVDRMNGRTDYESAKSTGEGNEKDISCYIVDFDAREAVRLMLDLKLISAEKFAPMLDSFEPVKRLSKEIRRAFGETAAKYSVKPLMKTSRMIVFELDKAGLYHTDETYEIYVNDEYYGSSEKVIDSIYGLKPSTAYNVKIVLNGQYTDFSVKTDKEYVTLNVRDFGAFGDGLHDDTTAIQCAIMACPGNSRVFVPEGTYRVSTLFLKSNLTLELAKNAIIRQIPERNALAVLPGRTESTDGQSEMLLGSWEGNPLNCFSGMITGINVENVVICGQGILDGGANAENWWKEPKKYDRAWRPRLIFLSRCKNVTLQGVTVENSPSWNIHPNFSTGLKFYDFMVFNPKDSPNTDGLDPESCSDVEIAGVFFTVGDDCIAIKSGKIYMGSTYKTPSENFSIRHCLMRDGHGSVTVGSEMAGGIKNIYVRACEFRNTDRGLRIKTRRGRGKDAVIDNISFENISMDNVMTPVVINEFYFCDPDGHSEYVQSRDYHEPDDRLPYIGRLTFNNLKCTNCHAAGAYIYGLPEKKIGSVTFQNVDITFAQNPVPGRPAMMDGLGEMTRLGIFAKNVEELILNKVTVNGCEGERFQYSDVDKVSVED